jgi:hypothetical protein
MFQETVLAPTVQRTISLGINGIADIAALARWMNERHLVFLRKSVLDGWGCKRSVEVYISGARKGEL